MKFTLTAVWQLLDESVPLKLRLIERKAMHKRGAGYDQELVESVQLPAGTTRHSLETCRPGEYTLVVHPADKPDTELGCLKFVLFEDGRVLFSPRSPHPDDVAADLLAFTVTT